MNNHTPGPWVADWMEVYDALRRHICSVHQYARDRKHNHVPAEHVLGNAQLIAAAPELLEALEACVNYDANPDGPFAWEILDKARAAIAKAKGEVSE